MLHHHSGNINRENAKYSPNQQHSQSLRVKIQFYFQSKKPLIGMIDGEAKFIIQKSNSGFVVNSGNYFHLSKLLLRLSEKMKKDKYKKKGINGFKFTQKYFNKKKIIRDLKKILNIKL